MFEPIFSAFGPVGSSIALLAVVLPVFAVAALETLRSARPRSRARIAYPADRGDSRGHHASRGSFRGAAVRLWSVVGRVGAGAAAERRTG